MKISYKLFLVFLVFATACSDDDVVQPDEELATETLDCSTIEAGQTLTLENRNDNIDYIINCEYTVNGDLIIQPGVTIEFDTDAGIRVNGSIQILGTENEQVVLTAVDKNSGAWRGIFIDSEDVKSKIEYAKIEYAGGGSFNSNGDEGAVIVYTDTYLNMNNTTITNSATYGFNASYGGDDLTLENNTISLCDVPMLLEPNYVNSIVGGNYTGNETDAIYVANGFINIDVTMRDLGVPYHALARLVVSAGGGKLTIEPGVELEFGLDGNLEVNEGASGEKPSLIAVGTAQNPILFSGINKVDGAWKGIYFDSPSPLNEIGFATIEYASNFSSQEGAIEAWYGTVLNVHDVSFKNIQNCALHQYISSTGENTISTANLNYENVTEIYCQN